MQALRSSFFHLFQVVTVIPYALACILWWPLPRPTRYRLTVGWPRMVIWGARAFCGVRHRLEGWQNLPNGPAILLSKHQSTWETMYLASRMPRELCFVFKHELLYVPFFGWGIGLLDMIHIDRKKGADAFESVVAQGTRKLAEGRWIIMFPEGTRTAVGGQGRYKTGGSRLATRTDSPVVPIAVNSGECWPRRAFVLRPGMITVSIGPLIETKNKTPEQINREVESWIEAEMRRLSPHAYTPSASNGIGPLNREGESA
ncbi:MAG: lysophospholipid acyltransferase family protein [Burkholderiaceae bacterium]